MAVAFFATVASIGWSAAFAWSKWLQHKSGQTPGLDQRLDRIEQAIDTVAVEVERLGEAQRFTARLLQDGSNLGAGTTEARRGARP